MRTLVAKTCIGYFDICQTNNHSGRFWNNPEIKKKNKQTNKQDFWSDFCYLEKWKKR